MNARASATEEQVSSMALGVAAAGVLATVGVAEAAAVPVPDEAAAQRAYDDLLQAFMQATQAGVAGEPAEAVESDVESGICIEDVD
eukprot:7390398-Prymnesium_polylepis.4